MKKKPFKVNGTEYKFICSAHDDIQTYLSQINGLISTIEELLGVARQMGVNMEEGLYKKRDIIDEREMEIEKLKARIKKYKARIKKYKEGETK